ncbi:SecY-interacting protein Syd [Pontibacter sp. JAM-7]|uniref:SecY-interacting protein Syd n=1 Tax=Pontibacter sp. JAM-7 TaxID=3366581 RepID=UPI003AF98F6C
MSLTPTEIALDRFMHDLRQLQPEAPRQPYSAEWLSDCYQQHAADGVSVGWRPTLQAEKHDMFQRLSEALEEPIHPDIVSYYGRYWSDPLPARRGEDQLTLLQVWNPADLERLRENLIGHALNKRRAKASLTLFFACVEPNSEWFISLDNTNGNVLLEAPGKPAIRELSDSLPDFLNSLTPTPIPDQE